MPNPFQLKPVGAPRPIPFKWDLIRGGIFVRFDDLDRDDTTSYTGIGVGELGPGTISPGDRSRLAAYYDPTQDHGSQSWHIKPNHPQWTQA